MIHSSKTAYVAIADHRDASGAFKAGDIVIVDEPALLPVLFAEGSLDPLVVVDASLFTPGVKVEEPTELTEPATVPPTDDAVTAPAPTGHRPAAHRMQTASRAKARRS